ncbi:exodeoxyribonuclease III [bacterium]|jgi:exodeoxyribonuclease-3|nr:exodeoxyribonuclease III [bacterium]|tara:strand:+ start:2914 stop:3723 length:810 start_codon:yes stop_codon:yes gene_type:complete
MKIVSFNINSIRARPHQLLHIRDTIDPDVIGIQETKVNDPDFPIEEIKGMGYHVEFWGQKGHYGVALLSKIKPKNVQKGFIKDKPDDQKRFIQATYKWKSKGITIMNGYFPQGENRNHATKFPKKIKFYNDLKKHIKKLQKTEENLIVMGDFNVAPSVIDIGIGENNAKRWLREGKTAFLPEEIDMWNSIKNLGFIDSWRHENPEEDSIYSWFDYRSRMFDDSPKRGLRIDHIMISSNLLSYMQSTGIDYAARAMEKPSDHCPIWIKLK